MGGVRGRDDEGEGKRRESREGEAEEGKSRESSEGEGRGWRGEEERE